jgi:hypothetical protein
VLISLAAGMGIVATFHRKSTTRIVAVLPTFANAGSTPSADPGSGTGPAIGSYAGSRPPSGGSTETTKETEATATNGGGTQPGPASTSGPSPSGSVTYDSKGCDDCGQTGSPGRCSGWTESFTNHSSTDVTGITFDPPAGKYQAGAPGSASFHTWPVPDPASVTLNLDIKASKTQKVRFLTCTSKAPPAADAFFIATAPAKFTWEWITGQRGSACFATACG